MGFPKPLTQKVSSGGDTGEAVWAGDAGGMVFSGVLMLSKWQRRFRPEVWAQCLPGEEQSRNVELTSGAGF